MNEKQIAKEYLEKAIGNLLDAKFMIEKINAQGAQFDYCTDSKLSDLVDQVEILYKNIEKIVYQK